MSPDLQFALTVLTYAAVVLIVALIVAVGISFAFVVKERRRAMAEFGERREAIRRKIARPTRIGGAA